MSETDDRAAAGGPAEPPREPAAAAESQTTAHVPSEATEPAYPGRGAVVGEPDITPGAEAPAAADGSDQDEPAADGSDPDEPAPMVSLDEPAPPLAKLVEAILIVVDQPVTAAELAQVTERPRSEVSEVLQSLAAGYAEADRGFVLREVAAGWRLYSAADCAGHVERFVLEGQQARLTQAALETLAVVAYRQPVTRAAISGIRGVNVDGVVRTLLARGLIEEAGQETSGATLYVTTPYFLDRLGLGSLDELPSLAPYLPTDIDALSEQF